MKNRWFILELESPTTASCNYGRSDKRKRFLKRSWQSIDSVQFYFFINVLLYLQKAATIGPTEIKDL